MNIEDMLAIITEEANAAGVPVDLATRIFGAENFKDGQIPSSGTVRTDLESPKGARGVFQVMPSTQASLERMGLVPKGLDPNDPRSSAKLGIATLKESLARTGDPAATIAEYNGGTAARRAVQSGQQPPAEETRRYMQNTGASKMATSPQTPTQPQIRTSITKRDPGDVASLMSQLDAYSEQQSSLSSQLSELLQGGATTERSAAGFARQAGEAAAQVAEGTGRIEVAKQEQQQQILQEFGISVDDPRGIVQQRNQEIARARVAQENLRPVIEQKLNTGITDDPLQWIINQFELPGLKRQFNSERMRELTLIDQENTDRQRAVNQIAADAPNLIKETQLLAAQRAAGARAQAAFEAAKAEGKAQHLLAAGLQEQMANNRMDFNTRSQIAMRVMDTATMKSGETRASAKFREDTDKLNLKLMALGKPAYTEQAWADLGPQLRTQMRMWGNNEAYGTGPGDALTNILAIEAGAGFQEIAPMASQAIRQWRNSKEYDAALKAKTVGPTANEKFKSLPQEQQAAVILDELAQKWRQEVTPDAKGNYKAAGFDALSEDNPYRLNTVYALNAPELKDNWLNQRARDQFKVTKDRPATDKELLSHAKSLAIADPANIKKYAQQTAEYFQRATQHQFKTRQLALLGFKPVNEYVMNGGRENGAPTQVNVVSPAEVERWMMSQAVAAQKAEKIAAAREGDDPFATPFFGIR